MVQAGRDSYDSTRRTPRGGHGRVVRVGTETGDGDDRSWSRRGIDDDGCAITKESVNRDDDERILRELPPHWAVFNRRS